MSKLSEKTLRKIGEDCIRVIYNYTAGNQQMVDRVRTPPGGLTERFIADQLGRDKELIHRILRNWVVKYPGLLVKQGKYTRWCVWNLTPEAKMKYSGVL